MVINYNEMNKKYMVTIAASFLSGAITCGIYEFQYGGIRNAIEVGIKVGSEQGQILQLASEEFFQRFQKECPYHGLPTFKRILDLPEPQRKSCGEKYLAFVNGTISPENNVSRDELEKLVVEGHSFKKSIENEILKMTH